MEKKNKVGIRTVLVSLRDLTSKQYLTLAEAERETGFSRPMIEAFLARNQIPVLILFTRYHIVAWKDLEFMLETLGPQKGRAARAARKPAGVAD